VKVDSVTDAIAPESLGDWFATLLTGGALRIRL
jgi:hypothetical protein